MTELKDELKAKPGEDAVAFLERAKTTLERHREETGERRSVWGTMPGEEPSEILERVKIVKEAEGILEAGKERRRERENGTNDERKPSMDASYRTKSQERDVERSVEAFEAAKAKLYRKDGSKVYGDAEHAERMDALTADLREKVEAVAEEASKDAEGHDREALALSYTDPTKGLTTTDRERLSASMPLVKEDCEGARRKRLQAVWRPCRQARTRWRRCCTLGTLGAATRRRPHGSTKRHVRGGPCPEQTARACAGCRSSPRKSKTKSKPPS